MEYVEIRLVCGAEVKASDCRDSSIRGRSGLALSCKDHPEPRQWGGHSVRHGYIDGFQTEHGCQNVIRLVMIVEASIVVNDNDARPAAASLRSQLAATFGDSLANDVTPADGPA